MFLDWLAGAAGGGAEVAGVARIARLILAGGTIARGVIAGAAGGGSRSAATSTGGGASAASGHGSGLLSAASALSDRGAVTAAGQEAATLPLREADAALAAVAAALPIDVLPGEGEPSNVTLPQQALHPCLLPLATRFSSFRSVPNPYAAGIESIRFLGSSGQPVVDLARWTASSRLCVPGAEAGFRRKRGPDGVETDELEEAEGSGGAAPPSAASSSSSSSSAAAMEVDSAGGAGGAGGARKTDIAALGAALAAAPEDGGAEEGDGGAAPAALAAATGGTSGDKSLAALAGTGAGAGREVREAAAADVAAGGGDDSGMSIVKRLEPLDLLTNTLFWRHMAPTAPDSLPC
jgi:hypothetical protein